MVIRFGAAICSVNAHNRNGAMSGERRDRPNSPETPGCVKPDSFWQTATQSMLETQSSPMCAREIGDVQRLRSSQRNVTVAAVAHQCTSARRRYRQGA